MEGKDPILAAPAPPEEGSRRRPGSHKRKASGASNSAASAKRLARERNNLPPLHNGPCTRARQSPNKLGTLSHNLPRPSPLQPAPGPRDLIPADGVSISAKEEPPKAPETPAFDVEFEAVKSRDPNAHVIPIPAGWYSWTKIHPIEERSMPSFFSGKTEERTRDVYMEIRNAIMKKFHADPQTNVELKHLSEFSIGNLDARQEVMEFLDHWGLINFHPFPLTESAETKVDVEKNIKPAYLVPKLYKFEMVQTCLLAGPKVPSRAPSVIPQLLPDSFLFEDLIKSEGPAVDYHCNSCSADCSRKRYHCQKQADFDLCTECYNEGKFGSGMTLADFILMEPAEAPGASGGSWTDQETLLLLEALELFGENWNEIAEHVATKTKNQCMLHFVQMPIEDPFLEDKDDAILAFQGKTKSDTIEKTSSVSDATTLEKKIPTVDEEHPLPSLTDLSKQKDVHEEKPMDVIEEKAERAVEEKPKDTGELPKDSVEANPKGVIEVEECIQDMGSNFALDALNAAFEAVGSFPQPDGSFSFIGASNPVMTLAAFLAGLVEPDSATAAARSSHKAMSEDSPSIKLAARHCYLLEDPPSSEKDHNVCESSAADSIDQTDHIVEKTVEPSGSPDKNNEKESAAEESPSSLLEKSETVEDAEKVVTPETVSESGEPSAQEKVEPNPGKGEEVSNLSLNGDAPSDSAKEPGNVALPTETTPDIAAKDTSSIASEEKEKGMTDESDTVLQKEDGQPSKQKEDEECSKSTMDVKIVIDSVPSEEKEQQPSDTIDVEMDIDSVTAEEKEKQPSDTIDVKMDIDSVPAEEKEKQPSDEPNITVESEKETTMEVAEAYNTKEGTNGCLLEEKDDQKSADRLKRAALTALSAAAVKAKLLADQEEDQILELVSLLIKKQLHKLETKLSVLVDVETVIVKLKEQVDRARQRLYHERAQIIASRLGLPASSSRPMVPSLPPNRVAMNYANMGLRPPVNTSLRASGPSAASSAPVAGSIHQA